MIRLANKALAKELQDKLDELQSKIDKLPTFPRRVKKAQSLWKSKGGRPGKLAFERISEALYDLCVYTGVCNYCEQNEANDIEHIFPKSFFPEVTFKWENYLLACKQCNTGFKLDVCHVLDDNGDVVELTRGGVPPFNAIAFINPRIENPNDYMILNLLSYRFEILPTTDKEKFNKANSTLSILELNFRDTLIQARKGASRYYYEVLNRLINILNAQTQQELTDALTPCDNLFDLTLPLDSIKGSIKSSYKKHISSYQHPSVWHSIKVIESKTNSKWRTLFEQIPEALTW